ncbi:MAG: hypothetical protein RQ752_08980, partial [Thermohalobaculum sp.]|nr:hypothetical protein [Thermohalobaculum sp.]
MSEAASRPDAVPGAGPASAVPAGVGPDAAGPGAGPAGAVPAGVAPAGVALIEATNTHLYPGAWGRAGALPQVPAPCLVVFADGACAAGRIAPLGAEVRLDLDAHRTARGRTIAARAWRIAQAADGTLPVLARIGGE